MRLVKRAKWKDIQGKVKNMQGQQPKSQPGVKNAVQRVQASGRKGVAVTNYKNCGRKRKLTPEDEKKVVAYVQKWRKKLFCTCNHIKKELKLDVALDLGAGCPLGLKPWNSREIQLDLPKSAL